ncbi:phage head completion protein [Belliella pelovolcani]|uniref:Phage head-tail joining protein n=1 Tax=Belliella pelovolcani TaxID=529505 RepID=A0A1N7MRA9_9BACT|nr:head-tail adaptor protein [Belliella pelovolcani]SIS88600.1 Phage head-tail joining protein [Belliella pelovolcani]
MIHLEDLRYLITLYQPIEEKNSVGQLKETFVKYSDFFASKYQWQNREQYEGKQLIDSDIVIFKIYFDENINTNYIIDFEDKNYRIKGIKEIGYKEGLEITAQYKSNK